VLIYEKPSSVKAAESHLRTYIRKHLGKVRLHELTPQIQQNFVTLLSQTVSRKTVLNVMELSALGRVRRSRRTTARKQSRRGVWHCRRMSSTSRLDSSTGKMRARSSHSLVRCSEQDCRVRLWPGEPRHSPSRGQCLRRRMKQSRTPSARTSSV
jgi:hypothetical protein